MEFQNRHLCVGHVAAAKRGLCNLYIICSICSFDCMSLSTETTQPLNYLHSSLTLIK